MKLPLGVSELCGCKDARGIFICYRSKFLTSNGRCGMVTLRFIVHTGMVKIRKSIRCQHLMDFLVVLYFFYESAWLLVAADDIDDCCYVVNIHSAVSVDISAGVRFATADDVDDSCDVIDVDEPILVDITRSKLRIAYQWH